VLPTDNPNPWNKLFPLRKLTRRTAILRDADATPDTVFTAPAADPTDTNSSTGQKLRSAPSSLLTLGTVSDPNTFCQAQHIVTIHARLREVFSRVCEGAANLLPSPFQAPRASPGATELQQVALTAKQLTAKPGLDDSPDFKGTPSPYAPSPALPSYPYPIT